MDHVPAWVAGAGGGSVASIGQFVGGTFHECVLHLLAGEYSMGLTQLAVFVVGAIIMGLCGAVIAFFLEAKTKNRWTLFLAGAAFTSIGFTALPGVNKFLKMADMAPISVAYAATDSTTSECGTTSFVIGLKEFFGVQDYSYRVVVGSFKDKKDAETFASKLNDKNPDLKAFVGPKAPCNEFYPVVVGTPKGSLREAQKSLGTVLKLDIVPGAYISKLPTQ